MSGGVYTGIADMSPEDAEIFSGYFDGFNDTRDEFPEQSNRSALYRHGWLNGRDDRLKRPRASAETIRAELAAITAPSHPQQGEAAHD